MRTSKLSVFVRSCVVVFMIFLPLSWLWNAMTGQYFWTPFEMAISAVLTVAFYGGIAWLITNVGMGLLFGRKPEYHAYKNSGGDPFFDNLPKVFNPGQAEPRSNFVPPASWQFVCPQCGARVEKRIDVCCRYGADSDNTAYFRRYGDVKPPEISEEKWADIRRRHGH